MKYAFIGRNDGLISVTATKKDDNIHIIYEDNGSGISDSITFTDSSGFGMQLIGMLVEQIDGSITIEREYGTRFIIILKD